jgi:hypothetical protein
MTTDLSIVDPLRAIVGPVDGFISSRLMAAYKLDDGHVIHVRRTDPRGHRQGWYYLLERNDETIFEGTDFETVVETTYGEAARGILGFLTNGEGDVEADYFATYTAEQIAWRDEFAENLSLFGMEEEDDQ